VTANRAASVLARLKNRARADGEDLQYDLVRCRSTTSSRLRRQRATQERAPLRALHRKASDQASGTSMGRGVPPSEGRAQWRSAPS